MFSSEYTLAALGKKKKSKMGNEKIKSSGFTFLSQKAKVCSSRYESRYRLILVFSILSVFVFVF